MPNGQVSRIEADDDESMGDFRPGCGAKGRSLVGLVWR